MSEDQQVVMHIGGWYIIHERVVLHITFSIDEAHNLGGKERGY